MSIALPTYNIKLTMELYSKKWIEHYQLTNMIYTTPLGIIVSDFSIILERRSSSFEKNICPQKDQYQELIIKKPPNPFESGSGI
jgi:hypothetical protein